MFLWRDSFQQTLLIDVVLSCEVFVCISCFNSQDLVCQTTIPISRETMSAIENLEALMEVHRTPC